MQRHGNLYSTHVSTRRDLAPKTPEFHSPWQRASVQGVIAQRRRDVQSIRLRLHRTAKPYCDGACPDSTRLVRAYQRPFWWVVRKIWNQATFEKKILAAKDSDEFLHYRGGVCGVGGRTRHLSALNSTGGGVFFWRNPYLAVSASDRSIRLLDGIRPLFSGLTSAAFVDRAPEHCYLFPG